VAVITRNDSPTLSPVEAVIVPVKLVTTVPEAATLLVTAVVAALTRDSLNSWKGPTSLH